MKTRQRDALLEHWRAEIVRESATPAALGTVVSRALSDPDLRDDPELLSLVQRVADEQRALQAQSAAADLECRHVCEAPLRGSTAQTPVIATMSRAQIEDTCTRLVHELEEHARRLSEPSVRALLFQIQALRNDHPDVVEGPRVAACQRQLDNLIARRTALQRKIEAAARSAVSAAEANNEAGVRDAMQALGSIHRDHPALLADHRMSEIREDIIRAATRFAHEQAVRALAARERDLAAEIGRISRAVHQFHQTVQTLPPETDAYRQAEEAYGRAMVELRAHDSEWHAALILELSDRLEECGSDSAADTRLGHFLDRVRALLHATHVEADAIETVRRASRPSTRGAGARPTQAAESGVDLC